MVILYIEDDENDVCLVGLAVRKIEADVRILSVPSVVEAQGYLQASGKYADRAQYPLPDLILLDLYLPGRDGFEFLRWREHTPWAAVPLVALTSSLEARALERATQTGATLSFVKPNTFSGLVWLMGELCRCISARLSPHHSRADPVSPRPPHA